MQTFNSFTNNSGAIGKNCSSSSNISHRPEGSKYSSLDNNALQHRRSTIQFCNDNNVDSIKNNEIATNLNDLKVIFYYK